MIKFGTGGWREIIADGFSRGGPRRSWPATASGPTSSTAPPPRRGPTTSQDKDFIAGWKEFLGI